MQTKVEELVDEIMSRLDEREYVLCLDNTEAAYIRRVLNEWLTEQLEEYGDGD